jgi:parallel beta-helix repeat protein
LDIYVSANSSINGSGTKYDPLYSIEEAIILARSFKEHPVSIWLREGDYFLTKKLVLNNRDDRSIDAPLIISAYGNEEVNIFGGIKLKYWNSVIDSFGSTQLKSKIKKSVKVTNLKDYGITNFGSPKGKGVELFYNNIRMTLARYPNKQWLTIEDVVQKDSKIMLGAKGSIKGEFTYNHDLPLSWNKEKDIWLHGYWFWDWADENQKIKNINIDEKVITLDKPYHFYGYRKGQEYYAYNLLSEIDIPNEWYLDRETGNLYFYPPKNFIPHEPPVLSVIDELISMNNVNNVTIRNLSLSIAKNNGITIKHGSNNVIDNVVVKNIGNHGVVITDSPNSKISNSEVFAIGASAIIISGGDRNSLLASNICAINNIIHNYATIKKTYNPGISLNGVGNCAKNNEVYDAPHIGIFFSGNNHLIEYNKIHHVVENSNDAGAIYTGRDWSSQGSIIRFNYLHDIVGYKNIEAKGIYLDDEASGTLISGNVFDNVKNAVFIGGGKDNIVDNNLFIKSEPSIHIDNRGLNWASFMHDQLLKKLNIVPYTSEIWKTQYPNLATVLEENTRLPIRNIVTNNVFFDNNWNEIYPDVEPYIILKENHFLNDKKLGNDYQLYEKLIGFSNIPFDKIGVK